LCHFGSKVVNCSNKLKTTQSNNQSIISSKQQLVLVTVLATAQCTEHISKPQQQIQAITKQPQQMQTTTTTATATANYKI